MMMNFRDDKRKCEEYIRALEDERVKVQVFQRELPLCLELVTQAIEAYKQQLSSNNGEKANNGEEDQCVNGNSECSEQETSSGTHGPVLEEFIPLKNCNSSQDHHHVQEIQCNKEDIIMDQNDNYDCEINDDDDDNKSIGKKSDWLRSVQLWNQPPDPNTIHEEDGPKRGSPMMDLKKKGGGAFQPFQKEKAATTTCNNNNSNVNNNSKPTLATAASSSSSVEAATPCTGGSSGGGGSCGGGKREEKGGQRKARRCWSPELHKRFLHALHQLGGSHVATPKQIRELMKVDGLTNDEVKSHLQKYRLHTARKPSCTNQTTTNPPPPQFVVVGGIWMPPPEYTAAMATPTPTPMSTPNGVYAPIATMASAIPCSQQHHSSPLHCEERGCQSDGGVHSNSTSTSSTHTTKTSHVY